MIRPKTKTEDLLFSVTKSCETINKQTHTKPQETLEFKFNKSRLTFHFNTPLSIEVSWMIGLVNLEVHNYMINIIYQNNKFELYKDTFDITSYEELKGGLEEIVNISNNTNAHLEDEFLGSRIISAYRKLEKEKRQTDGCYMFLWEMLDHHFEILKVTLKL